MNRRWKRVRESESERGREGRGTEYGVRKEGREVKGKEERK